MSKRLQVLFDEAELRRLQRTARREKTTVAEWVRRTLRAGLEHTPASDPARRLAAIAKAAEGAFPTGEIDSMLAEIERGYGADPSR